MLPVGGVFAGRFEIDRLAGKGGMGYVYRAFDRERTDWVVLKVLHVDSLRDRERFDREARVLAELSHPNIVSYVAHGVAEDGQHFLAMEWLDTKVRVTIADTFLAAGDRDRARAALADALHHIALRSSNIADGAATAT